MSTDTEMYTEREATRAAAWAALATVYDPELDEPVTDLGFVTELSVGDDGAALVRLRLPTYFCAPNFAYLMVADAHDAVAAVPGVDTVAVRLDDHFASAEINAGMAAGSNFADAFDGLAEQEPGDELGELRRTFWRKAHLACIDRVCRQLLGDGWDVADLAGCTLGEVPECADLDRLRRRRYDLRLPAGADAPLLVDDSGQRIRTDQLPAHLRFARTVRVSIDANTGFCRGVLQARYGEATDTPSPGGEIAKRGDHA